MAKIEVLNLNELVDEVTSSNVNVTAANQAVVDATTKASEASASAGIASLSADSAAQSVLDIRDEALRAEAAVISAENQVTLAETKAAEALDSAALAESARVTAEQHRNTSLDVLSQVEQVYDNFDDRYLGGHSSDPVVDNDGDDIVDGALYWSTTEKALKLFNQTALAWQSISESSGALLTKYNLADIIDTNEARDNLDVYAKGETNSILQLDVRDTNNRNTDNHTDGTTNGVYTLAERAKLAGIEDGATADQTGAEIKSLYEGEADTNAYTDSEKSRVDISATLDTTATTLPTAINEIHDELNDVVSGDTDIAYDNTTSELSATTLSGAVDELDSIVDVNTANIDVIINTVSGLSDASGSVSSSVEVNIPIDGSLLAVSGYTVKTQSTDTDVFELDGATGKVIIKTPGKYSFVMTFYAKALDKDPTITPRIVINSNAGIVYDDTLGLIKVKKDGIIFPTNVLIEVTEGMLAGGDLELDMEIGHVETVNANRQVAVTGFDAVISTMGGVYSGFADHGQLTGITDADSHPASAISVAPSGNLSSDTVQLALEELQGDIDNLTTGVDEAGTSLGILKADVSTEGSVLKSIKDTAENATYTNTTSGLTATTVAGAIDEVESRVGTSESVGNELKAVTGTTVDVRYDKLLAVRDVIDMEYVDGDLSTVRYEGDDDATVYYRDVMTYDVDGNLVEVKHYFSTADLVTTSGQTVLTYSAGDLATATYSE
jgi:hypothetical protein